MIYTSPIEIANQNSDSYFTISRRAIINVLIQVIAACVSGSVRSKWVTEAIWVQTQIRIQTTSKLQTPNPKLHLSPPAHCLRVAGKWVELWRTKWFIWQLQLDQL